VCFVSCSLFRPGLFLRRLRAKDIQQAMEDPEPENIAFKLLFLLGQENIRQSSKLLLPLPLLHPVVLVLSSLRLPLSSLKHKHQILAYPVSCNSLTHYTVMVSHYTYSSQGLCLCMPPRIPRASVRCVTGCNYSRYLIVALLAVCRHLSKHTITILRHLLNPVSLTLYY